MPNMRSPKRPSPMPTKISTIGVGLLMLHAVATLFAQRNVSRAGNLGASFHFSGLGPALMCSSHSQYSPAAPTMPAVRVIHPFGVAVK